MKLDSPAMTPRSLAKWLLLRVVGVERYCATRTARDLRRAIEQHDQILFIHQMGKVGSMSLARSLLASGYNKRALIYHTHFLSCAGRAFVEKLEDEGYGGWDAMPAHTREFLTRSRVLGRELREGVLKKRKVKVITLVRDPVATNLSGFFFNSHWWPSTLVEQCRTRPEDSFEALRQCFLDTYPHDVPLSWFDMELKTLFGVDVLDSPFDQERGYQIYEGASADVLLLKLEALSDSVGPALREFLGLDNVEFVRANEGNDWWYGELYREFKSRVSLPSDYLGHLYNSRFMHRFYSTAEIDSLYAKWAALS